MKEEFKTEKFIKGSLGWRLDGPLFFCHKYKMHHHNTNDASKKASMKKQNYWFLIPKQLKEDIEVIDFGSTIRKNKALRFVHILRNKAMKDNYDTLKFIELSASWFKGELSKADKSRIKAGLQPLRKKKDSNFGGRYREDFLDTLIEEGIIECKDYFSSTKHISLSFRINEKYFSKAESYSSVSYSDKVVSNSIHFYYNNSDSHSNVLIVPTLLHRFLKRSKKHSMKDFKLSFPSIEKSVVYNMADTLNIDYVSIMEKTKEVVDGINSTMFKVDNEVEFDSFELYNRATHTRGWFTKPQALSYIRKAGLSLIQDKDKIYIDDLDRYVETKKKNIYSHYTSTVEALRKGIYHVKRNESNFRLDTLFTSMCSHTLEIIKRDNDLIEIDLVNSQYAILANWLMNTENRRFYDVKLFCKLAIEGGLYEYIAGKLNKTRSEAKKIMMMVCFSSHLFNSSLKAEFKKIFPNVNAFIQSFKKGSNESSDFAIELQRKESRLFIDGLLKKLIEEDLFVLTKHDSLIIKKEHQERVLKIAKAHFEIVGFNATIKVEDELIQSKVLDMPIQGETIPAINNTQKEAGADNEEKKLIYAERYNQIKERYIKFNEINRELDRDSIIGLQIMSDKYELAKELLELIRA